MRNFNSTLTIIFLSALTYVVTDKLELPGFWSCAFLWVSWLIYDYHMSDLEENGWKARNKTK